MPLTFEIDTEAKMVVLTGTGTVGVEEAIYRIRLLRDAKG